MDTVHVCLYTFTSECKVEDMMREDSLDDPLHVCDTAQSTFLPLSSHMCLVTTHVYRLTCTLAGSVCETKNKKN